MNSVKIHTKEKPTLNNSSEKIRKMWYQNKSIMLICIQIIYGMKRHILSVFLSCEYVHLYNFFFKIPHINNVENEFMVTRDGRAGGKNRLGV